MADTDRDTSLLPKRRYASARRAASAGERRAAVVATATAMLREVDRAAAVSLDSVARAAGVTRLTVYNQFGSRQGLLEAVAEALAQEGGITRLADAGREPDAETGLAMAVEVFCRFWTSDAAIGRIYGAIGADPDVAAALEERLALGRGLIENFAQRLRPDWDAARQNDAADLVRVLTDYPSVVALSRGRGPEAVAALVLQACRAVMALSR